jgi:hypothetical protein
VITARDLLGLGPSELGKRMEKGFPVSADDLAGFEYRGTSLGLPSLVERLTWKTFVKAFHRPASDTSVRGWNVRMEQTGLGGPLIPKAKNGIPITFGHFRVVPIVDGSIPHGVKGAVLIDYGVPGNPAPLSRLRDPVVALNEGDADTLLGFTYVDSPFGKIGTPSFFSLERARPLTHVPPLPGGTR